MPIVRKPLAISQGYNDSVAEKMTFSNAYSICDKLKAQFYEGVHQHRSY